MSNVIIEEAIIENFHGSGSPVELRIYADSPFTPLGEDDPVQAGRVGSRAFYAAVTCTVNGTDLTIPELTLFATTDGTPSTALYTAAFYARGHQIALFGGLERFFLPPTPSPTNWGAIAIANSAPSPPFSLPGSGIFVQTGALAFALRTLTAPAAGLTITNPAGIAGNPTFALANNLAALEAIGTTGLIAQTGVDTVTPRTITGTANRIGVTNGDGVAGNPTLDVGSDVVTLTGSQTLTNKILTSPTITGGSFSSPTFTGTPLIAGYPRTVEVNTFVVGNVLTGLDTLHAFTLPAGSLAADGDFVEARYSGTLANTANTKRVRVQIDGQAAADSGLFAIQGRTWTVDVVYIRVSATSVRASVIFMLGDVNRDSVPTVTGNGLLSAGAATLTIANLTSNAVILAVQAEATATDDVTQTVSVIKLVQR